MTRTRTRCTAPGDVSQFRRMAVVAWGGAAVSWQLCAPAPDALLARLVSVAAFLLLATGTALYIRQCLLGELRRTQEIAGAAQQVLLRPLPPRMEGLALAAAQLSASRGAAVGGDLYEAVATPYGVRLVIGDVRGHGLPALGAAAAVLGSFREAAHDEQQLAAVLRRMERALQRYLRERVRAEHPAACAGEPESPVAEEFVTVLLLEIAPDGRLQALNCGHPWPYRLRRLPGECPAGRDGYAEVLSGEDPLPPLGAFPLPADLPAQLRSRLLPDEALFLHTDGAEDARDHTGGYFPLRAALTEAAGAAGALSPAGLVAGVHAALLRHTSGRLADDVALLVVRNDRRLVPAPPHGQAVCRAATPHGT
ncbi:PP2C family protein-serine/threonine phosphatase [Streptomyces sp. NPDC002073]|uniref:PP2C family protein-serine/threonine phosphatase n=1 Tax=Streptomyces sp. NBC_00239 TaxID=2903640 RepID=UPI002E2CAF2A|nr:PP2C family protein-serine/threonine phosphatase [Streptomyces sp. NBC_00239]